MNKHNKSGSAIFMYCVIAVTALSSLVFLSLYYLFYIRNNIVLWTGITSFTIMYHLWLRIIFGNITKLFRIHYNQRLFKEKSFEKKLYNILKVKSWKNKALTYNPELFSLKGYSLEEIADVSGLTIYQVQSLLVDSEQP